jgi:[ribosomal protein S5]-alanine N-acetyltransferase
MEISVEGIILRPWSLSDDKMLTSIADNKRIADNLRDGFPNPYSLDDARKWLKMIISENDPPKYFAILADNCLAGSIGIVSKTDIYRKNVEIGYFIAEKDWSRGIATKAIRATTSYAFSTFDIVRVYAEPFADNPASRRALEKAGLTLEAVFKNYVIKNGIIKDSCIYSVLKEDWKSKMGQG